MVKSTLKVILSSAITSFKQSKIEIIPYLNAMATTDQNLSKAIHRCLTLPYKQWGISIDWIKNITDTLEKAVDKLGINPSGTEISTIADDTSVLSNLMNMTGMLEEGTDVIEGDEDMDIKGDIKPTG